jgi:hypothetical protein
MVFTNPIMTAHVHKTIDRPLISSIDVGKYKLQMQKIQKESIGDHLLRFREFFITYMAIL